MTISVTLSQLVDRTVFDLMSPNERGARVVLSGVAGAADVTLTIVAGAGRVASSDVVEFGDELVLVTAVNDAQTQLTVSRGYYGTTAGVIANNTVGHVNPPHVRIRIAEAIRRSFTRLAAFGIPLIKVDTFNTAEDETIIELPEDAVEVFEVLYQDTTTARLYPVRGWRFFDHYPIAKVSSGKVLNVPRATELTDDLEVVYRVPYRWSSYPSDPVGSSTIEMQEGTEDLPALYAAAWLVSAREVSRTEIDQAEEWGRTAAVERGVTAAIVRAKWQEFYRALDEARRVVRTPQNLEWRFSPRLWAEPSTPWGCS